MSKTAAVLDIPELLSHVVSFLQGQNLLNAALVSRYWSESSLSRLWEHLPELIFLVRVLHPLTWSEADQCWVLTESSAGPDWARYEYYARRIRTLRHTDRGQSWWPTFTDYDHPYHMSQGAFELLLSRGPLPFGVNWFHFGIQHDGRDIARLPALLHSHIKHLEIKIRIKPKIRLLQKTFVEISQIPGLQLKGLRSSFGPQAVMTGDMRRADAMAPLLESQKDLEKLEIDECFGLGPRTVQAIVGLSTLRALAIGWPSSTAMSQINGLILQLSEGCPILRELKLSWVATSQAQDTPFNFNDLYKWELEVVELSIQNARPSVDDIRRMGKAWPDLKVFKVNWNNKSIGDESNTGLPLSALDIMAHQWPKMVVLNTVLDCTQNPPPAPTARFKDLQELQATEWYIPEDKVGDVADYLMALGVSSKALRLPHAWITEQFAGDVETEAWYESSRGRWRAVAALMI